MSDETEPVSRRDLMRRVAGGLGLAAAASVAGARPAGATNGDIVHTGSTTEGFYAFTRIHTVRSDALGDSDRKGLVTTLSDEVGSGYWDQLRGALVASTTLTNVPGVNGYSRESTGVFGSSYNGNGVFAASTNGKGIVASSVNGRGIDVTSTNATAIVAASTNESGVVATSVAGDGVAGTSDGGLGVAGVRGTALAGNGVVGRSRDYAGVAGYATADAGVVGSSSHGWGLVGQIGNNTGRAQLWLQPGTTPTPPSGAHQTGEVYMGSTGVLHQCVASGSPGEWLRVGFNPVDPVRICDTRDGAESATNAYAGQHLAPMGQGGDTLTVTVTGPIVPVQASSVMLNVTVTNITAGGFLTVYPANIALPLASNLNFAAPAAVPVPAVPNLVAVKLGAIPSSAQTGINIYNGSPGTLDVIVDVAGFFS